MPSVTLAELRVHVEQAVAVSPDRWVALPAQDFLDLLDLIPRPEDIPPSAPAAPH